MKRIVVALVLVVIVFALGDVGGAGVAMAADPSDATLAIVQCSGMSLADVTSGQQAFDTAMGLQKQLVTQEQWQWSYVWRVNEYAHRVGCQDVLTGEGGWTGTLTFSAKYFVPVMKAILVFNKFEAQGN